MQPDETLDLCGILEPYSLLLCKSALSSLAPGSVLEVLLNDLQTLKDLTTILMRSGETILSSCEVEIGYCLWVRKETTHFAEPH